MKNIIKYTVISAVLIGFTACDVNNDLEDIKAPEEPQVALNANNIDFSKYVSIGASFTAGFTDNALFKASQENSFPNILAKKFAMANGGAFNQPLMNDNIGGLVLGPNLVQGPRLYFNGEAPTPLQEMPTTDVSVPVTGEVSNYGIPGAKSFHFLVPGYGNIQGLLATPRTANPYFVRMASSPTVSVLDDILTKDITFFTLSEIGGNDVLGYALSGGESDMAAENYNPITPTASFDQDFGDIVQRLTTAYPNAKGVIGNVPYITSLAHFTSVPHDPLDPSSPEFAAQIPTLNTVYGAVNQIFEAMGETDRMVMFSDAMANPVVIKDENLTDLSATIAQALGASPEFPAFVQQFGLPVEAVPLVAGLLGAHYGQSRPATADDLLVLPSSSVIGTVNSDMFSYLLSQGLSQALAGQFAVEGISLPLEDKWVLTPEEQNEIQDATDAYNTTIEATVAGNENLALVDFKGVLLEASTGGIEFDGNLLTTSLVTGGLISLDGVHLTGRGYALMANKMLEAIDKEFGSNFTEATDGLAKAEDYPTNYSPSFID